MATKSEIARREVPPSGPSRRRRKYKRRSKNSTLSIGLNCIYYITTSVVMCLHYHNDKISFCRHDNKALR